MLATLTGIGLLSLALGLAVPLVLSRSRAIRSRILASLDELPDGACIVVLGCHVATPAGRPNRLFVARIAAGAAAYHALAERTHAPAPRVLATGHGPLGEADALRDGLVAAGVPRAAITLDAEGLRTIHSVERAARDAATRAAIVFVSQRFHLPRTLWLADRLGLEALGLPAEGGAGPPRARLREHAAWLRAIADVAVRRVRPG